ncbi:phosphatase PAP2 family protein [Chitinophagaceae bacterium LWZ2-11]
MTPHLYSILSTNFLDWLLQLDTDLFLLINKVWTNSFLDSVYPWYRDSNTWVPFYVFLLAFILMNFGKKAWLWILFIIITVALTDQVSSNLIKHLVARPRPCNDPFIQMYGRLLLGGCSGGYSFTSSHAANHFGMAMFMYLTLKPYIKNWGKWFFVWAATISYGQIYVGVHYPLDVLGGTIVGCILGYCTASIFIRRIGLGPLRSSIDAVV